MKKPALMLCAAAFVAILSNHTSAAVLSPGATVATGGTTVSPLTSGIIINDNLIDFIIDPTPITPATAAGGNVQNRVVRNALNNLLFAPRIRDTFNVDGGTLAITGFSLTGYAGFDVDVDFRTDGDGDKGQSSVSRSADGDTLDFDYMLDPLFIDSIIPPGRQEESLFPSILTNATAFDLSGRMTIRASLLALGATTFDPQAPTYSVTISNLAIPTTAVPPPVPLPLPLVMLATGLFGIGLVGRRKSQG